ncbi:MAG: hypothetical protein FJW34_12300 [Acidobacteria bacterium]|nr:hypothetical protein [Acidobacteriota bacterium]
MTAGVLCCQGRVKPEPEDLLREAAAQPARVLRYLTGRLYADPAEKWRAVRALGELAAAAGLLSDERLGELLRRYFWALNDESGAVPWGIPEAIGELLAVRPSFQRDFLPLLCSLAHQDEVFQTGPILEGVCWALGRVGPPVAACDPEAVAALRDAAAHPDAGLREAAAAALARIET